LVFNIFKLFSSGKIINTFVPLAFPTSLGGRCQQR
jgi:hypothetical protein